MLRRAGAGRRRGSWYRLRAVLPCGASAAPQPPGSPATRPAHSPETARSSEILRGRSAGRSAGGISDRVLQAAQGLLVGGVVEEHGVAFAVGAGLAEGLAQAAFGARRRSRRRGRRRAAPRRCAFCEFAVRAGVGLLLQVEGDDGVVDVGCEIVQALSAGIACGACLRLAWGAFSGRAAARVIAAVWSLTARSLTRRSSC